jgi:hypothetical protein
MNSYNIKINNLKMFVNVYCPTMALYAETCSTLSYY